MKYWSGVKTKKTKVVELGLRFSKLYGTLKSDQKWRSYGEKTKFKVSIKISQNSAIGENEKTNKFLDIFAGDSVMVSPILDIFGTSGR